MTLKEAQTKPASSCMCLSLEWDPFPINSSHSRIVISHSDGSLSTVRLDQGSLELDQTWQAHDFELWTTTFDFWKPSVVYSGADDCHFCVWDLREDLQMPVYRNRRAHRMGVCCVQSNPLCEHVLVTGSYDETIRLWDSRMLQNPVLEAELGLGGGVWKVKWHPKNGKLLLAACMHNGFAILHANSLEVKVLEEYKGHKSLAYGADWYRGKSKNRVEMKDHQEQTHLGCQSEAEVVSRDILSPSLVATCSFYDSALHLWEPRTCLDH
ncbi:hypothetical protein O6H91_21G018500 [Diphasiastrum complanatum]|nr:hypothetical protein O6H91_21G018500 [Diphasiastrum complanatum]